MTIRKEVPFTWEKRWQEEMKDWEGRLPDRMVNDESEEIFWKNFLREREGKDIRDEYAQHIFKEISHYYHADDHILEIGPGWGNYTFSLASTCKQITVVDSSIAILDYLKMAAQKQGFNNIEFKHNKLELTEQEAQYDVIFGMNCFYRMFEIKKALSLINRQAKRLAVIGMTTGPIQPHYQVLNERYGYDIKFPKRDYVDLLNLLYELGIYADCKMIPLMRTYKYKTYEELITANTSKILSKAFNKVEVGKVINDFIRVENGKYVYDHHFHAAIISWVPKRKVT